MKRTILASLCVAMLASSVHATSIQYQMFINGDSSSSQLLPAGNYTLEVRGIVTDNDIVPGTPGGFLQSSFDLIADTPEVVFQQGAGFIGAPNGLWASTSNAAFQQHNAGAINPSGDVIEETGSVLQAQWNTNFSTGANAFAFIASGNFSWTALTETTIELQAILGNQLVAVLDGANVGAAIPTGSIQGDSITLTVPSLNDPPVVTPDGGTRGTRSPLLFTHQFNFTDDNDSALDWEIVSFDQTSGGTNVPANYSIDANGLFSWDTTGTPNGNDQVYTLVVRGTDSGDLSDLGSITITMPEPGTMVLAGLSLVGLLTSRRKLA